MFSKQEKFSVNLVLWLVSGYKTGRNVHLKNWQTKTAYFKCSQASLHPRQYTNNNKSKIKMCIWTLLSFSLPFLGSIHIINGYYLVRFELKRFRFRFVGPELTGFEWHNFKGALDLLYRNNFVQLSLICKRVTPVRHFLQFQWPESWVIFESL